MEQRTEEYIERTEKHLHSCSEELTKQIFQNGILKEQITFLIDKIVDMDFVLHGPEARNINWFEISKGAAYRSRAYKDYKWGDKIEEKQSGNIGVVVSITPHEEYQVHAIMEGEGLVTFKFKYEDIAPVEAE